MRENPNILALTGWLVAGAIGIYAFRQWERSNGDPAIPPETVPPSGMVETHEASPVIEQEVLDFHVETHTGYTASLLRVVASVQTNACPGPVCTMEVRIPIYNVTVEHGPTHFVYRQGDMLEPRITLLGAAVHRGEDRTPDQRTYVAGVIIQ